MADSTIQMFDGRVATVGDLVRVKMWSTEYHAEVVGIEPTRDVPFIRWGEWDRDWDEFFFTATSTQEEIDALGDLTWTWPL